MSGGIDAPGGNPIDPLAGLANQPPAPGGVANYGNADAATPSAQGGASTIWNIPTGLPKDPVTGKTLRIWYDNGTHSTYNTRTHVVGAPDGIVKLKTGTEKYRILKDPQSLYNFLAGLAAEGNIRDKHGMPTKEALGAQQQFLAIQQSLGSGPWGSVDTSGSFDPDTQKALGKALLQYAGETMTGAGENFVTWLTQTAHKARLYGQKNKTTAPQQITQLTDPTAIRAQAQQAALSALGHGLSEDQLSAFVTQFQSAQTTYQTSTSGTVTAPDLSSQAGAYAQTVDPAGFKANTHQSYLNALVNMFAPTDSTRPDMGQPVPSA